MLKNIQLKLILSTFIPIVINIVVNETKWGAIITVIWVITGSDVVTYTVAHRYFTGTFARLISLHAQILSGAYQLSYLEVRRVRIRFLLAESALQKRRSSRGAPTSMVTYLGRVSFGGIAKTSPESLQDLPITCRIIRFRNYRK